MLLAEGDPLIKFLSLLIYAAVSLIWVIFIFLTALRDYNSIALGYVIGTVITIFGALILGRYFDLIGYFIGTLLGQFTIMILLSARIYIEFPSKRIFDKKLFSFLSNNKILILTGIFYNLAIWIDKIVFWYSPGSIRITNFLRMFPDYEIASFFAYMTIIPFLSIFMIHVETHFYLRYRTYYEYILNKGSYREIKAAKKEIKGSLRFGIAILIASQSVLTIVTIIFAPNIINALALPPSIISIFRICVLGAFLHGLLLVNIIAILYFDFKVLALLVCTTFMLLNGLFAYVTTMLPTPYIGTGYLLATILSLILSFYALNKHLKKLEFITFSKQSI